jgi:hypothetical protein
VVPPLTFVDRSSSLILNGSDELDYGTVVADIVVGSGIRKSEEHAMQMIERARVILAIVALCGASSMSIALAEEAAFLDAQALIAGWRAHYGGIDRMHFRLSERVIDDGQSKGSPLKLEDLVRFHTAEMTVDKATKRFHLRYSRKEGGLDEPLNAYESAFDGEATRQYWEDGPRRRGRVAPGLRGNPGITERTIEQYLLNFTVGYKQEDGKYKWVALMDHLSDLTESGDLRVVVEDNLETVANEVCHAIEVAYEGKPTYRLWFARAKGMLPMKYQSFSVDGDILKEMVVIETAKAETDTGITWYPSKANLTQRVGEYDDSGNHVTGPLTYQLEVFEFTPNVEVDESTFRFEFPAGTEVRDEVRGVDYTVTGK